MKATGPRGATAFGRGSSSPDDRSTVKKAPDPASQGVILSRLVVGIADGFVHAERQPGIRGARHEGRGPRTPFSGGRGLT